MHGSMGRGGQERGLTLLGVPGVGARAAGSVPPAQPVGRVPAEPAGAGAEKLVQPFPTPALPVPVGLGSSPQPQRLYMCIPRGFPAVPTGVGGQGFEPQSLSPTAVPRHFGGTISQLGICKGGITPGTKPRGLLPWALLPSPRFCCAAGLQGSPRCCCRAPQVKAAQSPEAD